MFSCTYVWYVMSCTHSSYSLLVRQLAVAQQPRDLEEASRFSASCSIG